MVYAKQKLENRAIFSQEKNAIVDDALRHEEVNVQLMFIFLILGQMFCLIFYLNEPCAVAGKVL